MKDKSLEQLSRRERQLMDIIYRLREASVAEVLASLTDPPSYSSVRALLAILENKGLVGHEKRARAYVYFPIISHEKAQTSVLKNIVQTFFDGSVEKAVNALLDSSSSRLSEEQLDRLDKLIRNRIKREDKK